MTARKRREIFDINWMADEEREAFEEDRRAMLAALGVDEVEWEHRMKWR